MEKLLNPLWHKKVNWRNQLCNTHSKIITMIIITGINSFSWALNSCINCSTRWTLKICIPKTKIILSASWIFTKINQETLSASWVIKLTTLTCMPSISYPLEIQVLPLISLHKYWAILWQGTSVMHLALKGAYYLHTMCISLHTMYTHQMLCYNSAWIQIKQWIRDMGWKHYFDGSI